jgi:hypothetical protein|tara:strand:+ start:1020 stop:1697 length:678 start_codon:yes stop_codon:yes gene_type:complete
MTREEEEDDDVLNSIEAVDIQAASSMERGRPIAGPSTFDSAVKSNRAFNNPGSATTSITTSIIDDGDISMRSRPTSGGGQATLTLADGSVHIGPKFEPGEKRRRKHLGLSGERIKAVKLKLDECVLVRANEESRSKEVSIFVVNDFCGLAFRVEKGPIGSQILYVLDGEVYDSYNEKGIPDLLSMQITPDDEGNGWVMGGEKIPLQFLSQFVNSILQRVAKQQIT